jgi:hypothetical protein
MKKNPPSESGLFNPRVLVAFTLCSVGVLLAMPWPAAAALPSTPDRTFVTNGLVEAVVRAGDTIYIGGRFDRVGPRTGPAVELGLDGSQHAGLPEVTGGGGSVQAVVPDGTGGWYIGGLFTHVGGVARRNIAHIRADHSVDPNFDPNANDGVHALVISGSTLYAGGLFTSIGGQARNRIAALNAADGTANAFNPNADAAVEALAVSGSGSIIYAGGRFTMIGGQPRVSIAALNAADGSATATFNLGAFKTDVPSPGPVRALAISGSTLYVGGSFGTIGGQLRNNIAALNAGGLQDGLATSFNPDARSGTCAACGGVDALAVSGSTVYAGGLFTTIGGVTRNYLAAINATDGTATSFNPNPNGNILGLAVSVDGLTVYAGGGFNSFDGLPSIGGQVRNYLAAINAADGTVTAFNPNPNGVPVTFGVTGSAVYMGGYFSSIGGLVRHNVAAINALDGTATPWDPNATREVFALAVSGPTIYLGGFFSSVGGLTRNGIAAVNAADGSVTGFNPDAGSFSSVYALAVSNSIVYAGGFFSSIGGQPRSNIAAINAADGTPTNWNPNANSGVQALAVSGPLIYAGGFFTTIGGQTRNKIAALNAADGTATSWDPDPTSAANVLALAVSGSTIYAGGNFTSMHGLPRKNLAAVSAADGTPTSFDPQANDGVFAVAVSGSTVYAGGVFSTIGGQTRNVIAELNSSDGTATSFDPGGVPGFITFALAVTPNGTLYAAGSSRTFELAFQQGFAQFSPTLKLSSAVSRKTHGSVGTFDIDLPLTGPQGIECRSGGANGDYTMVFTFANPLTSVSGASVSSGTGTVSSSAIGSDAHQYVVNLTGVSNAQVISVGLTNVTDSAGNSSSTVSASMGVLIGDASGNGTVSNTDVASVKAQVAAPVTASNFRNDVNVNGTISNTDVSVTKAQVGTSLQ